MSKNKILLWIKLPYWLGIAADALWAVAFFTPPVFGLLTGNSAFDPDPQLRLAMAVAGTLLTGWTCLLAWAVREPIARRFVSLLTAFPVVFGLFVVALIGVLRGNTFELWILLKNSLLFIAMLMSYILAERIARHDHT